MERTYNFRQTPRTRRKKCGVCPMKYDNYEHSSDKNSKKSQPNRGCYHLNSAIHKQSQQRLDFYFSYSS